MGTMAEYEYPDITVSQAVDIIRVIEEKNIERLDVLANSVGHQGPSAYKGGAFRAKLSALNRYGFLVGKQSELHLSDLAKQIVHPRSSGEKDEAIWRAAMSIPILKKVHEKLKGKVPADFWVPLYDCTGVDQKIAKENAEDIKRLYADAIRYFQQSASERFEPKPDKSDVDNGVKPLDSPIPETLMRFRSGEIDVSLPISDRNLDVMNALLDSLRGDAHGTKDGRPHPRPARHRRTPTEESRGSAPPPSPP
jgi:hypothetical protein